MPVASIGTGEDPEGTRVGKRLDPLEILTLRSAVIESKRTFKMRGRNFKIKYKGPLIWYQPTDGFVPCGYWTKKRLERYVEEME